MRWHRQTLEDKTAREPVTKEATVEELLAVMLENFEKLVRHITFIKHLSVAQWQHHQYRYLKENLKQNKVMLVMDFAENVSSQSQDEIKSLYFNKRRITLHPVIAFYRCRQTGQLIRNAMNFITNDTTHDHTSSLREHSTFCMIQFYSVRGRCFFFFNLQ